MKTSPANDQSSGGKSDTVNNFGERSTVGPGLLDAIDLLAEIWPRPNSRPSLRWLREQQRKRTIPFIKVGHKVFFNPVKVRQALEKNFTVECV